MLRKHQERGSEPVNKASTHLSADECDRELRKRLRGRRLVPQTLWMLGQAAYIVACIAAFIAVLRVADGLWLAVGLTVVAFFAGGIFEVLTDFHYSNYRQEWELANGLDLEAEQAQSIETSNDIFDNENGLPIDELFE
jgi:hypothetical protein